MTADQIAGTPTNPNSCRGEGVSAGQRRPVNETRFRLQDTPSASRSTPSPIMVCCGGFVHDHMDGCWLVAEVTDRRGPRYLRHGEARSHVRGCKYCSAPTWALDALCDRCAVARAVGGGL